MSRKSHGGIEDKKRKWLMERGYTYDPKTGIRLGITGKVGSKDPWEQAYIKKKGRRPYIKGPPERTVGKGPVVLPKPKGYAYLFPAGGGPRAMEYTGKGERMLHGRRITPSRITRFAGDDDKLSRSRRSWLMERGYTHDPKTGSKLGITGKVGSKQDYEQRYIHSGEAKRQHPYGWGRGKESDIRCVKYSGDEPPKMTPKRRSYFMERGYTHDPATGKSFGITGKVGSKQPWEQAYIRSGKAKRHFPYMWGRGEHDIRVVKGPFKNFVDWMFGRGPAPWSGFTKHAAPGAPPHNPLFEIVEKY